MTDKTLTYNHQINNILKKFKRSLYHITIPHFLGNSNTYFKYHDDSSQYPLLKLICQYVLKYHSSSIPQELKKECFALFGEKLNPVPASHIIRLINNTSHLADETNIATTVLNYSLNTNTLNGNHLSIICKQLILHEVSPGGPYVSNIKKVHEDESPRHTDCDIAVNCIIKDILTSQHIQLPQLNAFIRERIESNTLPSDTFASKNLLYLIISNHIPEHKKEEIVELIISSQSVEGYWENMFETACALITLRNLGVPSSRLGRAYEYLRYNIDHKNIEPCRVIYDSRKSTQKFYIYSDIVTAFFSIIALGTYDTPPVSPSESILYRNKTIINTFTQDISQWEKLLQERALTYFSIFLSSKEGIQASMMPTMIQDTFSATKLQRHEDIVPIAYIHTLSWFSYRLMDDLIDEKNKKSYVPLVSSSLRLFIRKLFELNVVHITVIEKILTRLDNALLWEIEHCFAKKGKNGFIITKIPRYPRYSHLSHKSCAAIMGPLISLYKLGFSPLSPEVMALRQFFNPYLIARQLSDDAQDWWEDLLKGYINPVGASVLTYWTKSRNISKQFEINIQQEEEQLKKIFWEFVHRSVEKTIIRNIEKARKHISSLQYEKDYFFEPLLKPLEDGIQHASIHRKNTKQFIRTFLQP